MDTSPETCGNNVKPQVIENYQGGDIVLPEDSSQVIRFEGNDELAACIGRTIITTDGTTLLGADDKAGIAVIMEAMQHLIENPKIPHGPIRICFTCDEEIGLGTKHVDIDRIGAVACYTLDGSGAGPIDIETFSADLAVVEVRGVNIHPSIAKDRMINAVRVIADIVDQMPNTHDSPETTDDRNGFLHPLGHLRRCRVRTIPGAGPQLRRRRAPATRNRSCTMRSIEPRRSTPAPRSASLFRSSTAICVTA